VLLTRGRAGAMLRATPPGQLSNLNSAAAVQDDGAPYQRQFSAIREVCQEVLSGHPQSCTNTYYTESNNITIDRICLVWYWLILTISCSALNWSLPKLYPFLFNEEKPVDYYPDDVEKAVETFIDQVPDSAMEILQARDIVTAQTGSVELFNKGKAAAVTVRGSIYHVVKEADEKYRCDCPEYNYHQPNGCVHISRSSVSGGELYGRA
jgi:hypothetical protein